jgi:hypothetical protein
MYSDVVVRPQCFFCDRILSWDTALIAPFGAVLCAECDGDGVADA